MGVGISTRSSAVYPWAPGVAPQRAPSMPAYVILLSYARQVAVMAWSL